MPVVDNTLTDKFSMTALRVDGNAGLDLGDSYAVCVVTDGKTDLNCDGFSSSLKKGDLFFVSAKLLFFAIRCTPTQTIISKNKVGTPHLYTIYFSSLNYTL